MQRVRIKICGITRLEDALLAASLGAYALGFIFYKKSPRYIRPERAQGIIAELPPFVSTVGVFVNEEIKAIRQIYDFCRLNLVQLHGSESPEFCLKLGLPCIKAIRIKDETQLSDLSLYQGKVKGLLLDTYKKGLPGGTGRTFNWNLAVEAQKIGIPIILAGGLSPDNIEMAIKTVSPYAIDVNSGIEKSPGVKDREKMQQVFEIWQNI